MKLNIGDHSPIELQRWELNCPPVCSPVESGKEIGLPVPEVNGLRIIGAEGRPGDRGFDRSSAESEDE
jgi:hypothetical protein